MKDETQDFNIKKWLISTVVTTSLVCGSIGGVAALFLADGFIDIGPDPAIQAAEVKEVLTQQVQQVDARIATLEKRVNELPEASPEFDSSILEKDISDLNEKLAGLTETAQESKLGQVVLAITQIKNAYDMDRPIKPGLDLLKETILDPSLREKISMLDSLTYPTRQALLSQAQAIAAPSINQQQATADTSWQGQAKALLGQFVTIKPKDQVQQSTLQNQVVAAIQQDNLPLAQQLIQSLPSNTAEVAALGQMIQQRLTAQKTVEQVISLITTSLHKGKTGLY